MKKIDLYTDGACSGNPGVGGYGIVLIYGDYLKEFSGVCEQTTNNQMEITAVIEGLKKIKEPCELTIYTDSAYTMNAFSEGWIDNWILNGWRTANKKPVKNAELWQELLMLLGLRLKVTQIINIIIVVMPWQLAKLQDLKTLTI